MGVFSIFSRKAAPASEPRQLQEEKIYYGDVVSWLDSMLSGDIARLCGKASRLCDDVLLGAGKLAEKIAALGGSSFEPRDKTYAAVNMTKDTFAKKSAACLGAIPKYDACDYGKLAAFRDSAKNALWSVTSATPKQAFLISNYFKQQGADIVSGAKGLESALAKLSGFLEGEGLLLKKAAEAKEKAGLLARLESERAAKQSDLDDMSKALSSMETDALRKAVELESFTHSAAWKNHLSSMERLADTESRMKAIEQEANSALSVLRKPMKKLSHEKGTPALPENPFRDVVMAGGEIESAIRSVSEAAETGEIDLKPSERERINALGHSAGAISRLRESYNEAMLLREKLKAAMDSGMAGNKSAMESELFRMEDEKRKMLREISRLENDIRRNHEEQEICREETRRAVQEASGKEVSIVMQKDSG